MEVVPVELRPPYEGVVELRPVLVGVVERVVERVPVEPLPEYEGREVLRELERVGVERCTGVLPRETVLLRAGELLLRLVPREVPRDCGAERVAELAREGLLRLTDRLGAEERLAPEEARLLPLEAPALERPAEERPLEPRPDLWASVDPSIRKLAKRATMTVIRSFRCNMRRGPPAGDGRDGRRDAP